MKKIGIILFEIIICTFLWAGELTGFSGLKFKSSRKSAEEFIINRNGTISESYDKKTYYAEQNERIKKENEEKLKFNEDLEKNKKLSKSKKEKLRKKTSSLYRLSDFESRSSLIKGKIKYLNLEWNFTMLFYDDMLYKVQLLIDKDDKSYRFSNCVDVLTKKLPEISVKYGLKTVRDEVQLNIKQDIFGYSYPIRAWYEAKDDKYSSLISYIGKSLYFGNSEKGNEDIILTFESYFSEVDKALGITEEKEKELKKAIQEYSEL